MAHDTTALAIRTEPEGKICRNCLSATPRRLRPSRSVCPAAPGRATMIRRGSRRITDLPLRPNGESLAPNVAIPLRLPGVSVAGGRDCSRPEAIRHGEARESDCCDAPKDRTVAFGTPRECPRRAASVPPRRKTGRRRLEPSCILELRYWAYRKPPPRGESCRRSGNTGCPDGVLSWRIDQSLRSPRPRRAWHRLKKIGTRGPSKSPKSCDQNLKNRLHNLGFAS